MEMIPLQAFKLVICSFLKGQIPEMWLQQLHQKVGGAFGFFVIGPKIPGSVPEYICAIYAVIIFIK